MKVNSIIALLPHLFVLLLLTLAGSLNGCVSSGENGESSSTAKGEVVIPEDPSAEPVSREQALAILERADVYLNPIEVTVEPVSPGKDLSIPDVGASESPRNDGVHDNFNNNIAVLQDPTKALADFPRDRRYQVDWVAALEQGRIDPRADLRGETKMQTFDLDIIMKNTLFMHWVKFPHLPHTKWLACSNCHPGIFIPQEHANPISMNKVLRGEYCGVCHDKVAFALFICERCHSVPHEGSGERWW